MLQDALLKKLASVDSLTITETQAVSSLCSDVRLIERRKNIASEGENPDNVHIVLSGWAARYNILKDGSRRITAFLLPGDFCDIHATVLQRMDHGIVALTDCRVAFVKPEVVVATSLLTPALARAFWRSTLVDQAILRRWLVKGRSEAFKVVGHLLGELYVRAHLVGLTEGNTLAFPVTQEEIGDATGLTAVHVNRVLKQLREAGVATWKSRTLTIDDLNILRTKCEFDPSYLHLTGPDSRSVSSKG